MLLKQNGNKGNFEIYHCNFQINEVSINANDYLVVLYASETIFEDCSSDISGILISCPNHEFDVWISKCYAYRCGIDAISFSRMTCYID